MARMLCAPPLQSLPFLAAEALTAEPVQTSSVSTATPEEPKKKSHLGAILGKC